MPMNKREKNSNSKWCKYFSNLQKCSRYTCICSFFSLFPSIPTNYRPKTFYRLQKIQQQRI